VTDYQKGDDVTPCFEASDCANYNPKFGQACCLFDRCICGSDADIGIDRCAVFAPYFSGVSTSGVTVPTVTVPTVAAAAVP
jgi:hypothetical protein